MNKSICIFICIIIIVFQNSCSNNAHNEKIIKASLSETEVLISDIFEEVKLIPLETSDSSLISTFRRILIFEDDLFILDDYLSHLFIFSEDGSLKKKIAKIGHGPGEYTNICDFTIDEKREQINLLSPFGTIHAYNLNGDFIRKIDLPNPPANYQRIINYDDENFLLWSVVPDTENGINFISKENGLINNSLWKSEMLINSVYSFVFSQFETNTYFNLGLTNDVYQITKEDYSIAYSWDFGKDNIDLKKYRLPTQKENINEDMNKLMKLFEDGEIPYLFIRQAQSKRYYYTQLWIKQSELKNLFFDKANNECYCFTETKEGLKLDIMFFNEDYILTKIDYSQKEALVNSGILNEKDKEKLQAYKEDDNPYLVKYYFKK